MLASTTFNGRIVSTQVDNQGGNWLQCVQNQGAFRDLEIWYANNVAAGSTTTTTTYASSGGASEILLEVSNLSPNNCDQTSIYSGTSTDGSGLTPFTGTTDVLGQVPEFVVGAMTKNTLTAPTSGPYGQTALSSVTTNSALFGGYFVAGSTSPQSTLWTVATQANWSAAIATFRGSNTSTPVPTPSPGNSGYIPMP